MVSTGGVLADLKLFNRVCVIVRLLREINRIVFVNKCAPYLIIYFQCIDYYFHILLICSQASQQ